MTVDQAARRAWFDEAATASWLLFSAVHLLGFEPLFGDAEQELEPWDPLAVRLELRDVIGSHIEDVPFSKLMGLVATLQTDTFFNDPRSFVIACNAITGTPPTDRFDPADPYEMAATVTEVDVLLGDLVFSEAVRTQMGITLQEHGMAIPPQALRMAKYHDKSASWADMAETPEVVADVYQTQQSNVAWLDNETVALQQRIREQIAVFTAAKPPDQQPSRVEGVLSRFSLGAPRRIRSADS